MSKYTLSKVSLTSLAALTVFLPVTACDLANNYSKIDRTTNSEFQDVRDSLAPREVDASSNQQASDIPELQAYVADDVTKSKPMPLVSIAINQSIPIREALFELAKQANYDIELDPRITGSIIFTARNRPFDEVIDKISMISGLRYKIDESSMRVELDTPYTETYKVDYLSFVRTNESTINTDVSVASSGGAGVGGGSNFKINSKAESDFWLELDNNLKQILASNSSQNYLKTQDDPVLSLTSTAPSPVNPPVPPIDAAALGAVAPQAGNSSVSDFVSAPAEVVQTPSTDPLVSAPTTTPISATPANGATPATTPTTEAPLVNAAAPVVSPLGDSTQSLPPQQPVLKVESLPTGLAAGNDSKNQVIFTPAYSINKQAGLVSVYGNERVQKKVGEYLEALRKSTTSQVLIEAKILEVSLSDEFSAGINWNMLDSLGDFTINATLAQPTLSPSSTNLVTFGFGGQDISSFVSALSRFGTVHALASPRLTVLNNQASVLNVAQNQVYFELKLDVTAATTTSGATTTINSTIKTVPEGVLINVMPSIDMDRRMVSLQVRPTVTKIKGYVEDPGVAFVAAQNSIPISSKIPIVNVQEIDSVLKIRSGEMMVLGGLLQDSSTSTQEGIPGASEIPLLGGLFRNQGDILKKSELVIFLKATILDDAAQSVHQTDKDLYKTFSQDRRPNKL